MAALLTDSCAADAGSAHGDEPEDSAARGAGGVGRRLVDAAQSGEEEETALLHEEPPTGEATVVSTAALNGH